MIFILNVEWKNPAQGRDAPEAPAHRDIGDEGRYQIVEALSDVAFDIWPGSHKLRLEPADCEAGHFHMTDKYHHTLNKNCPRVQFAAAPGDVLIFKGGHLFHGSPPVGHGRPSPRVVTYANFWPPDSAKGRGAQFTLADELHHEITRGLHRIQPTKKPQPLMRDIFPSFSHLMRGIGPVP